MGWIGKRGKRSKHLLGHGRLALLVRLLELREPLLRPARSGRGPSLRLLAADRGRFGLGPEPASTTGHCPRGRGLQSEQGWLRFCRPPSIYR